MGRAVFNCPAPLKRKDGALSLKDKMKKTASLTLSLLFLIAIIFSGCKIEFPEDIPTDNIGVSDTEIENNITDNSEQTEKDTSALEKTSNQEKESSSQQPSSQKETETTQERPAPVDSDEPADKTKVNYCTLSVDCLTILDNMDKFNRDKLSVLPKDGVIYKERKVIFYEGETVFDVLNREMKKNRIHMEFEKTPMYNSNYVEGIGNIYEFDCGELSGWTYSVNGWFPNYGCSRYKLKDGDKIQWRYTCDLGRDVGDQWFEENNQ